MQNVLFLKRSLVGPQSISNSNELYLGKEGLTGLWYIDNNSMLDQNEIEKLNIYYAKNQNIWLDLEILGKSFAKMFRKNNY